MVVTFSLSEIVADQIWYNMGSAQYYIIIIIIIIIIMIIIIIVNIY